MFREQVCCVTYMDVIDPPGTTFLLSRRSTGALLSIQSLNSAQAVYHGYGSSPVASACDARQSWPASHCTIQIGFFRGKSRRCEELTTRRVDPCGVLSVAHLIEVVLPAQRPLGTHLGHSVTVSRLAKMSAPRDMPIPQTASKGQEVQFAM